MAWDFETEPEFQEELDWVEDFVRTEIEPLDYVVPHPYDSRVLLGTMRSLDHDATAVVSLCRVGTDEPLFGDDLSEVVGVTSGIDDDGLARGLVTDHVAVARQRAHGAVPKQLHFGRQGKACCGAGS